MLKIAINNINFNYEEETGDIKNITVSYRGQTPDYQNSVNGNIAISLDKYIENGAPNKLVELVRQHLISIIQPEEEVI